MQIVRNAFPETKQFYDPWWRHDKETLSALLALCEGNPMSPIDSPRKGPIKLGFGISFAVRLNKLLKKTSQIVGDSGRQDAHVTSL